MIFPEIIAVCPEIMQNTKYTAWEECTVFSRVLAYSCEGAY